eukprot:1161476-Pelagomonas_calceolata.AAC.2
MWMGFSTSYFLRPAHVLMSTPADGQGEVCLDILKTAWSPAWTLHSVCQAIMALLSDPAADSPLNCDAAEGQLKRHIIQHARCSGIKASTPCQVHGEAPGIAEPHCIEGPCTHYVTSMPATSSIVDYVAFIPATSSYVNYMTLMPVTSSIVDYVAFIPATSSNVNYMTLMPHCGLRGIHPCDIKLCGLHDTDACDIKHCGLRGIHPCDIKLCGSHDTDACGVKHGNALTPAHAGNLLRAGDMRGYNCMARMYTIEYAMR